MRKKRVIIFLYNRLFDPVIQSNFWLFISEYLRASSNCVSFHLITYEDPEFPLTGDQVKLADEWKGKGLAWTQLRWHSGLSFRAKGIDILAGFAAVLRLRLKGYKHVISVASIAGSFVYLYSKMLNIRRFLYCYEPHSEYAVDNNIWLEQSLQYRIIHFLEKRAVKNARIVSSGTSFMEDRIKKEWKYKSTFFRIPTVVNDEKFRFNLEDRINVRKELNIPLSSYILFYPGKFGELYYKEEIAFMYKWFYEEEPNLHFLIVTPNPKEEVEKLFINAGLDSGSYTITHSDYSTIHKYFSASDFGVIAVPPGPSKRFISNIKVGEYLCNGLPYLIIRGVSEDYLYAEKREVGVVVENFEKEELKRAWPEVKKFLEMPNQILRDHCRKVGIEYRGFDNLKKVFDQALNVLLKHE